MAAIKPLIPRQPVPALQVPLLGGGTWTLNAEPPENFTLVVFYRGFHCPICSKYLGDLERKLDRFSAKGVDVIAISSDVEERAARAKTEWELSNVKIGYGLTLDAAREWGLYISTSRGKTSTGVEEPALFSEPGLYLVRADGTLFAGSVQTMPFARPSFTEVLGAVEFVLEKGYPARGEVVDHENAA